MHTVTRELFENQRQVDVTRPADARHIGHYQTIQLYEIGSRIIAELDQKTVYVVDYQPAVLGRLKSTQLTAMTESRAPQGLEAAIFWKLVYPKTRSISTDSAYSSAHRHFWKTRVSEALRCHVPVYLIQLAQPEAVVVEDLNQYGELMDETYGFNDRDRHVRLLIDSRPLNIPTRRNCRRSTVSSAFVTAMFEPPSSSSSSSTYDLALEDGGGLFFFEDGNGRLELEEGP